MMFFIKFIHIMFQSFIAIPCTIIGYLIGTIFIGLRIGWKLANK